MQQLHPVLAASIDLALSRAAQQQAIARATRPFQPRIGWRSRNFETRAERSDYERAFMCFPAPLEFVSDAGAAGWLDASKTAAWRREAAAGSISCA